MMMEVKMIKSWAKFKPGGTYKVNNHVARQMIKKGYAVKADGSDLPGEPTKKKAKKAKKAKKKAPSFSESSE